MLKPSSDAPKNGRAEQPPLRGCVLKLFCQQLKAILEEMGYEVYEANDGLEALKMYKKVKPQVVTMDINMPRMHGLKAAQIITDFDKEAKIMICSTMVMFPNYMKMGKEAGAKAFLSKPFDEQEFMNEFSKLFL